MRPAEQFAYVDTSAYLKRFASEAGSSAFKGRIRNVRLMSSILIWPEALSAIARKVRDSDLEESHARSIRFGIRADMDRVLLANLSHTVLAESERLLFAHPLRASDAVHLGTALRLSSDRDEPAPFLTADRLLATVATEEGLAVETFGLAIG